MPDNKENHDHDWQAVFSGNKLPIPSAQNEQDANQVRQYLIWRQAKEATTLVTADQAKSYYQYLEKIRKKDAKRKRIYWGLTLLSLPALVILLSYLNNKFNWDNDTLHAIAELYSSPISNSPAAAILSTDFIDSSLKVGIQHPVPEMVAIPSGKYIMGCSAGWDDSTGGCRDSEYPAHALTIKRFEMARFEVTVAQFNHFITQTGYKTTAEIDQVGCATKDNKTGLWSTKEGYHWRSTALNYNSTLPVTCISWVDSQHYLQWLNKITNRNYRLPTEEEWEYAARANKITAFYWGSSGSHDFANYSGQLGKDRWQKSAPVGQFVSNAFGLHDTAGNVWEWVSNCWRDNYNIKVSDCTGSNPKYTRRGGSWDNYAPSIRSAYRSAGHALDRSDVYGFRIAHDDISISSEK